MGVTSIIKVMNKEIKIKISEDFTDTPGARDRIDGDFSGEVFLENLLLPKFEKAVSENCLLVIDLEGAWGYPSSFISASFGKLSVLKGKKIVLKHIKFVSEDNPARIDKFTNEIINPETKS